MSQTAKTLDVQLLDVQVKIRGTKRDRELLRLAAQARGMTMSELYREWVRSLEAEVSQN